jgi:hemerythrin superfamily protein
MTDEQSPFLFMREREAHMAKRNIGKSASRTAPKKKQLLDALQMLKADHRQVEELFNQFMNGNSAENQLIAQQIFRELKIHSILEEELFYPMLRGNSDSMDVETDDINNENVLDADEMDDAGSEDLSENSIASSYDDHRMMGDQITQLLQMNASDPEFRQGMVELQEIVIAHVSMEEEELFPYALTTLDIKALGRQMQERKADILSAVA